ncbi:Bidirectional sugar transporter SWEET2 [Citrus sinensis]|nr:Bidirectional sugar transporter SWEET2 [Citrus sinensis]
MILTITYQALTVLKDAVGIAGMFLSLFLKPFKYCFWNIFAFGLFVSPVPTFRRIIRNHSTEEFSGLPYVYALLNCLITMWYGTPLVSADNILVTTVNSIGAAFQLVYIILFITYTEKDKKVRMLGLLLAVIGIFSIIVAVSLQIVNPFSRQMFVGLLSCAALISMFASPLFIINLVIQTKSVEFMPFYLSLSTFLMSTSFLAYGIMNWDPFIYVPNGIGTILGIVQLALYFNYKETSGEESRDPLIVSYA